MAVDLWEKFKKEVVRTTKLIIRECRYRLRNTYKQKLRRLGRQFQRLQEEELGLPPTVESITAAMDTLSLQDIDGKNPRDRIRRAIMECKAERAQSRQRRVFATSAYWIGKTTKALFDRLSCKYQDNTIPCLNNIAGWPRRDQHDKANILADAWCPILQQT
ncbi:hypothetical protein DVH05_021499, partial [Phytophthora capsici]